MRRPIEVAGLLWAMPWLGLISGFAAGQSPSAPAPPARRPEVWAIVVGVGNYLNPGIPDSPTAFGDAAAVRQWIQRAGWDEQHQLLLRDFGSEDPGEPDTPARIIAPLRRNLDWAFQKWLVSRAKPGDLVVFYFAGRTHTVMKPQGPRLDPRVDTYLLPVDAAENAELTGWSLDQAVDDCARRRLQVVCWLATTTEERPQGPIPPALPPPAAPGPGRPAVAKGVVPPFIRPRAPVSSGFHWLARLARWPGVTAWLASDRPRVPGAGAEPGALFTKGLLEALGKPDPQGKEQPNLAACLKALHQHPQLKLQGFSSVGGVPPALTLWKSEFGKPATAPQPELVLQVGHADKLTAVVSPADGRLIATASMDSTVRVWSTPERSLLRVLTGQAVGVTALALTRNDRWLISGGGRGAVLVYDRDRDFAPKLVAPRQPHNHRITQVVLLPDGVHFVSVDRDGQSMLWDPRESPLAPRAWLAGTTCQEVVCGGKLDPDGADTGIVVARCGDGKVRAFDSAGGGGAVLEFPQGRPTTLAAAPDGRLLAAGFDDGVVVVRDLKAQRQTEYQAANQPVAVRRLVISPAGRLAVGHERGARLLTLTPRPVAPDAKGGAGPGCFDLIDQPVQSLAFSPSGDFLAACTENVGALRVWRIGLEGPPTAILDDSAARACLVGFTGTGRGLLCGDFDGAVSLRPLDPQGDEAPWTFPANRGKLQQLSASPSRRFLLFLDEQRRARIWDLKERTCRRLQGTWSAGVLLDDDHLVLIPDSNAAEHAGRPVRFDRDKLQSEPAFFARTAGTFQLPDNLALERLVLSPDGSRIAAASDAAKEPFVCVWKTSTGQLTHWITPARLEDAVVALSFSSDGRYLLTGGDAPVAQLWDLSATEGEPGAPAATFADKSVRANITCAAIRPGHAEEVVTGHSDGQVHVWKWAEGKTSLEVSGLVAREFAGRVKALCFTADGQQLAAAGDGTRIWVGALDPQPRPIDVLERLRPHHLEQINALIAWPGKPVLISGSADTTVRFWDLQGGNLWGTFSAASRPDVADAAAVQELDWVFHTPDGLFDASPAAGKLVHYRRKDRPQQLDQFDETHKTFRLSEQLLEGKNPRLTQQPDDPPAVSITAPPRSDPTLPEVRLTITLGASDLKDVRLYHNDVVIPTGWGAGPQRQPGKLSHDVTVRLIPNRNRFQVMASREGAYDSSSNVVEVDYTGPMEAGQIHVLALGVGAYDRRRLQYARRDAEQLSAVLHRRGLDAQGRRGLLRVLPDTDVNRENVEEAFGEIARYVEDRPQDTVVVFLAGHTGVFDPQRFCLLLPTYPFPAEAPILVAARDVAPDSGEMAQVDPQFVLPYSVIALNLARLKALNRLVIVDACQAEAILADPRVRAIQKWMEISSRRARTSYLMAARRGEPALEVDPLGHGLFTYALLRGLGAIPGRREPKEVAALGLPRDADFNKDGIIATAELDAYSKQVLPRLASVFPQLVASRRDALVARKAPAPPDATAPLDQAAKLQGAETSFPLVPLNEVQGP